jgi:hypothetical protein
VNTLADCAKYIESKITSGICKKHKSIDGRETYEIIKGDGILKKGDLLTKDTGHYEWEFFNERGKHKGAIDLKMGIIYKPADPLRCLNVK